VEGELLARRAFDFARFCELAGASPKERAQLRQGLVRGLKDYFEATYGYDRYGAETILLLPERMAQPYIYGYGLKRLLHDRRISQRTKLAVARVALDIAEYGADGGLPYCFLYALWFLAHHGDLSTGDLRYGLVASAGETEPFRGMEKSEVLQFFRLLLQNAELPAPERAFWAHSLICRHRDQSGSGEVINEMLGQDELLLADRRELCRAWINWRQPRLDVSIPAPGPDSRSLFVAEHLPFWVAHAASWPTSKMVFGGVVWLARLGDDPLTLAQTWIDYHGHGAEQIHAAVAEVVAEHAHAMPEQQVKAIIERGIAISGSSPTRRRFYRLGTSLYGEEYLTRATGDAANSVRQWAVRQMQRPG